MAAACALTGVDKWLSQRHVPTDVDVSRDWICARSTSRCARHLGKRIAPA